jgi:hypothetical protein
MLRSALSKVAWVGRTASMVFGPALVLALMVGLASAALGATGGNFVLDSVNTAGVVSKLTANTANPALQLINTSTGAAATTLNLQVANGKPSMTVNLQTEVANLNADRVDGQSFGCPTKTLIHEGVCIETQRRSPAGYNTVGSDCLDEGRRLPTEAELLTFRNRSGHDFAGGYELTLHRDITDSTYYQTIMHPNGSSNLTPVGAVWGYRCVVPPC